MAKLPDFSELTKKFDIQGLVDSVKSAVGSTPPKAPEGDEVAAKFVEVITLMQNLATSQAEQGKAISTIHSKLNALYKDTQLLKVISATSSKKDNTAKGNTADDSLPKQDSPTEKGE